MSVPLNKNAKDRLKLTIKQQVMQARKQMMSQKHDDGHCTKKRKSHVSNILKDACEKKIIPI
jgi:hypothetical protein